MSLAHSLDFGTAMTREMTDLKALYEEDTVAWSENQAAALRAAAQGGSNQKLDWENLAEEIEDLGKSVRRGIHSHIRTIIEHLLKLRYSSAALPKAGWRETITNCRVEIDALLDEAPSVRPQIADFIRDEIPRAVRLVIRNLDQHDELNTALRKELAAATYTSDQILGDWFPPDPQG